MRFLCQINILYNSPSKEKYDDANYNYNKNTKVACCGSWLILLFYWFIDLIQEISKINLFKNLHQFFGILHKVFEFIIRYFSNNILQQFINLLKICICMFENLFCTKHSFDIHKSLINPTLLLLQTLNFFFYFHQFWERLWRNKFMTI